ncbi:hypothetical protein Tco_1377995 [Tanacetum coccineum]
MANLPNGLLEKDIRGLLGLLKQEVSEDVARVREYRVMACGLKVSLRRRKEHIEELKSLGDSKDVVESVMFLERMQLNDMDKCTRSMLMMKYTEVLFKGFWVGLRMHVSVVLRIRKDRARLMFIGIWRSQVDRKCQEEGKLLEKVRVPSFIVEEDEMKENGLSFVSKLKNNVAV